MLDKILSLFWDDQGELTSNGRSTFIAGSIVYTLLIVMMCFTPLPLGTIETPGIQRFGRLVVLLVPFNSLVNIGQVSSWTQMLKVIAQNVMNVFLLTPLVFQLICLFPSFRKIKKILCLTFGMSLFIESTQLLLDFLIDANRVFELDDLWTNTLGGYLAFLLYIYCIRKKNDFIS